MTASLLFILFSATSFSQNLQLLPNPTYFGQESDGEMVEGNSFRIPETQNIDFVPLARIDPDLYEDPKLPRSVNLRAFQSKAKSQGMRGACTYFAFTGLAESIIKQDTNKELDLSEEYLAWAGKVKKKLRILDEGSSVAVNASTFQDFGFMLEEDMPYQPSWFDERYPCEGQREETDIDPICYSHHAPDSTKRIFNGKSIVFEAIGSRSIDVVRALASPGYPVTISLIGHAQMWEQSKQSGDFFLSAEHKKECQLDRKLCGGHAVLAVGYDLERKVIFIKNSWGEGWGDRGYGTIPFDYLDQMSERKFLTGYTTDRN